MVKKDIIQYFIIEDREELIIHINEQKPVKTQYTPVRLYIGKDILYFNCIGYGNHEGKMALTLKKANQEKLTIAEIKKKLDSANLTIIKLEF